MRWVAPPPSRPSRRGAGPVKAWFLDTCKEIDRRIFDEIDNLTPTNYPGSLHFLPNKDKFKKISDLPFDKAFVERNKTNFVTVLDAGWSDLGSWKALSELQRDLSSEMKLFEIRAVLGNAGFRFNMPQTLRQLFLTKIYFRPFLFQQRTSNLGFLT